MNIKKAFKKTVNKLFPCKFGRCKDRLFGCNCGTFIGVSAGTIGTAALLGGGAYLATRGKKKQEGPEFDYYQTPQYKQLYDLLFKGTQEGDPGLEQYGQQQFQQLVPGIQETYQARRGLGAGSTPEVAALGRAGAGVATGIAGLQAQARQNYARLLAGITPQPVTTVQPQGPGLLQNLLSFGAPIAAAAAGQPQLSALIAALTAGRGQYGGQSPATQLQAPLYEQSPLQAAGGPLTYGGR